MHLTELNLTNVDKEFVWHPYTQMRDWAKWNNRVIMKGDGFYLVDSQGRKYLDGSASMWCNVWGHTQNKVVQAMIDQLKRSLILLCSALPMLRPQSLLKGSLGWQEGCIRYSILTTALRQSRLQ